MNRHEEAMKTINTKRESLKTDTLCPQTFISSFRYYHVLLVSNQITPNVIKNQKSEIWQFNEHVHLSFFTQKTQPPDFESNKFVSKNMYVRNVLSC